MPSEKTEGLEVVARRKSYVDPEGHKRWQYIDGKRADASHWEPLVRLSGALALAERAREEGIREALAAVEYGIAELEAKAKGFVSWDAELCAGAIRALLPSSPPEPKKETGPGMDERGRTWYGRPKSQRQPLPTPAPEGGGDEVLIDNGEESWVLPARGVPDE